MAQKNIKGFVAQIVEQNKHALVVKYNQKWFIVPDA